MHNSGAGAICDWLIADGARAAGIPGLVVGYVQKLNEMGFDIFRSTFMVRTLHPEIESIRFGWTADAIELPVLGNRFYLNKRSTAVGGTSVEEITFSHGAFARSVPYQVSPYKKLDLGAHEVRSRVHATQNEYPIVDDIRDAGGTDYFLFALPKLSEFAHRVSLATRRAGGFSEEQLDVLRSSAKPLAAAMEIQVNRLITENLLAVYLGLHPAQRVLAGAIKPGDVERILSAIWFSDLRGYTDLSQATEPGKLIEWLNGYFDTISTPIINHGGEILKYMGDAVLAIFPVADGGASEAAKQALAAAQAAKSALAEMNERRQSESLPPMRHGIALHIGEVEYGNVGANRRLDFTVIGPAVNKASRIEGLCKTTGRDLLLSADFAQLIAGTKSIGEFSLKGIDQPEQVFIPD